MFVDYAGDEYSIKITNEQSEATTLLEQALNGQA